MTNNLPIKIKEFTIDYDLEAGCLTIARGDYVVNFGEDAIEVLDIDCNFVDSIPL